MVRITVTGGTPAEREGTRRIIRAAMLAAGSRDAAADPAPESRRRHLYVVADPDEGEETA